MSKHLRTMRVEKVLCEVNKVDNVVSKLMNTTEEPGDYTGDDGLLYCGKCHTPKQTRLPFNPLTGDRTPTIVRAACQCQREADEEAERRALHRGSHIHNNKGISGGITPKLSRKKAVRFCQNAGSRTALTTKTSM